MTLCPHNLWERDVATGADGMCPLCLSAQLGAILPLARAALAWRDADLAYDENPADLVLIGVARECYRKMYQSIDALPEELKARLRERA